MSETIVLKLTVSKNQSASPSAIYG